MTKKLLSLSFVVLFAACQPIGGTATDDHNSSSHGSSMAASSLDRLSKSPRHQEWVEVQNGDKTIYTWVVYPESSKKKPVVLLIHENKGLNDWARSMADQVAEAGYIAVAPDLLSGVSATQARTSDFATDDAATKALGMLNMDNVMSDLQAVTDWAKTIPASNGKIVSAGFCWGGARSFQFATKTDDLAMAMVFYGTGPENAADYAKITAPVEGFYGGADARVNATIDASKKAMAAAGKQYNPVMYEGAGHAFMRSGEDPSGDAANVKARSESWKRMKELLETL